MMPEVKDPHLNIGGTVAPGFEAVKTVFRENFEQHNELGASCAMFYRGQKVVDLWGGYRDLQKTRPWEEDTLCVVFSTTKGAAAMCLALAHSRGWLDWDEPVATYWPEFAANGKEEVTVRQLISHRAGLAALGKPVDISRLFDMEEFSKVLAAERPQWTPGSRTGYHALTIGLYMSELLRRVDPQRRDIGRFWRDEIAVPLDCDFYIGLPENFPEHHVARLKAAKPWQIITDWGALPPVMVFSMLWPRTLTYRAIMNPRLGRPTDLDQPRFRRLAFASANGIGNARALAKAYSVFAGDGKELQLTAQTLADLQEPVPPPSEGMRDLVLKADRRFWLGFLRPSEQTHFGSDERAFGFHGAGGSFAFADPGAQVSFAYVMNQMGVYLFDEPREKLLREACYECLAKITKRQE